MKSPIQPILGLLFLMMVPTTTVGALACQPPEEKPLEQLYDAAVAVIHAKVMKTELKNLDDLGVKCTAVICEVIEVGLRIDEALKGNGDKFRKIYASAYPMCTTPVLPGFEYTFFLSDHIGLVMPNEYSFVVTDFTKPRLAKLREVSRRRKR